MSISSITPEWKATVRRALERSWSDATSVCFNPSIAPLSYGQCAPTAVVLFETYGGEILKTQVLRHDGQPIRHYYNRINGQRIDFTADQFEIPNYWGPLKYEDELSSIVEAFTEMLPGQLEAMRTAFKHALAEKHAG